MLQIDDEKINSGRYRWYTYNRCVCIEWLNVESNEELTGVKKVSNVKYEFMWIEWLAV